MTTRRRLAALFVFLALPLGAVAITPSAARAVDGPAFSVQLQVSKNFGGPWSDQVTAISGHVVFALATLVNTGTVPLTDLTVTESSQLCGTPSLAVGATWTCEFSIVDQGGTNVHTVTADSAETEPSTASATVITLDAILTVLKEVALAPGGPFEHQVQTTPGSTVYYRITLSNGGEVALTGVTLHDDTYDLAARGCVPPSTMAIGATFTCGYSTTIPNGTRVNTATADSTETAAVSSDAIVDAAPNVVPGFTVKKTSDAPVRHIVGTSVNAPVADEGDTITYTLAYTVGANGVEFAILSDTIPDGLTYVPGSAVSSDEIGLGYDPMTRTIVGGTLFQSGSLGMVTHNGSVSFKVTVDAGAGTLPQPIRNVVVFDSLSTARGRTDSVVYVGVASEPVAVPTGPPTDVVTGRVGESEPGFAGWLVVFGLGGLVGGVVLVGRVPGARGVASKRGGPRRRP